MAYTSQYPPAHTSTYVKATTEYTSDDWGWAYYTTDPEKLLTGNFHPNSWSSYGTNANQRFHIDLGTAKIIRRIYYENNHHIGGRTNRGAQNFTFWGSNTAGSFANLTYATDTGWTGLTVAQNTFDEHIGANQADPKYIVVTNTTTYRYYAFKFEDNYGNNSYMRVRRIELQKELPTYNYFGYNSPS